MKVLFVNPFFFRHSELERQFRTFYFPLGLLYLAAVTRQAGYEVSIFDGAFSPGEDAFLDELEEKTPDIVCLGSWITVQPAALRLAKMAFEYDSLTIMGGPGPSSDPAGYLDQPGVDLVVTGEGEQTLIELLAAVDAGQPISDIKGIAMRDSLGGVIQNPPRKLIHNLDSLPRPARDLINIEQYLEMWRAQHGYRSLTMSMSRGCPDANCLFCADSVMGPNFRRRSIDNVIDEMLYLQEAYPVERFRLVDDLNRLGRDWLNELGEAMMAAGVTIPYEGLNTIVHQDLPMLAQTRDICHERNAWVPTRGKHGHAPPTDNVQLVRRRWERALLLEGEHLEDP